MLTQNYAFESWPLIILHKFTLNWARMWLGVTHFAHLPVPWRSRMMPNTTCSHFHVAYESNCRYFLTVYWEHRSNNKFINSEWNNDQSSHIFVSCRKASVWGTQACFSGLMIFFFLPERNYNLCFKKKMW